MHCKHSKITMVITWKQYINCVKKNIKKTAAQKNCGGRNKKERHPSALLRRFLTYNKSLVTYVIRRELISMLVEQTDKGYG